MLSSTSRGPHISRSVVAVLVLVLAGIAFRPALAKDPCGKYLIDGMPGPNYLTCSFHNLTTDVGSMLGSVNTIKAISDAFDTLGGVDPKLAPLFEKAITRFEHGVQDVERILVEEEERYVAFTSGSFRQCEDLTSSLTQIAGDRQTAADLAAQVIREEMAIAAALAAAVPSEDPRETVSTTNIDPRFFFDRLHDLGSTRTRCTLLFPLHELLAELGRGQCDEPDPALCIPNQLHADLHHVTGTLQSALSALDELEGSIHGEEQKLCSEFAKLAGFDPTHPPATEVGWEDWQSYASILRAIGLTGQEIGVALQGIGDISINGISVGASVAAEGTVREGIDCAAAIGKNIEQIADDVQWLGVRIEDVVSFCRSDLNTKLALCLLQGMPTPDYAACKEHVLRPEDHLQSIEPGS